MTNIILLSKLDIVNQIFTLVCKKLSIDIKIIDNEELLDNTDLLLIDSEFLNDNLIKFKTYSNRIVLIVNKNEDIDSTFESFNKPFLPSVLESFLKNINITNSTNPIDEMKEVFKDDEFFEEELQEDNLEDLISFVDNISIENETISDNFNEYDELSSDEITVKKEDLGSGGILDANELDKLFDMINDKEDDIKPSSAMDDNDWVDLSDIIDTAIEDVQEYKFENNKEIKLILNQYTMKELSPLFNKLDQNIINSLSDGKEITLKLRLKND